jgi:serine protease Do
MKFKKHGFGIKTLIFVAVASVIAGVALTARLDVTDSTDAQSFWKEPPRGETRAGRPVDFVELAKRLSPMVVNISTTQVIKERPMTPFPEFRGPFDDFFGDEHHKRDFDGPQREFKRQSLGSGFIINNEGYILTNNHVIENAAEIIVTLSEGKEEYRAKLIGHDKKLDAALIKIDAEGKKLPVATIGDSETLEIGEWALAIGNPFGLGGSVTAGIVSQKGRVIGAGPYDNFIQTDASINPGNSGGPLFNMSGEVVGINTAIIAGGQGIGFATPINMVKDVLVQLKESGRVTRGWIGVSIQELTPELAETFGLKGARGALVSSATPGDPADAAGIKAGDIIMSFDGRPINELNDLPRTVASTAPGKTVPVVVLRDGKEKTLSIKVATKTDEEAAEEGPDEGKGVSPDKRLGILVQPLTPELAKRLGIAETDGVLISSVKSDSLAKEAGLRRGDVIKEINRKPVRSMKDFNAAMADMEKSDTLLFLVQRGNGILYVALRLKD